MDTPLISPSDIARFNAKSERIPGGCWLWTDWKSRTGYGRFRLGARRIMAHRMAWLVHRGHIPDGLELDHLCQNKRCVNPAHLEPVTAKENMRRNIERGVNPYTAMTHCHRGHEFNEENTYYYKTKKGWTLRYCRACRRKFMRTWKSPNAEAARTPQSH